MFSSSSQEYFFGIRVLRRFIGKVFKNSQHNSFYDFYPLVKHSIVVCSFFRLRSHLMKLSELNR